MIESFVAVLLRLMFVVTAFGIMATFFLLRMLVRKTYGLFTRRGQTTAGFAVRHVRNAFLSRDADRLAG